jgi:uncharacterized protein YjdB
MDGQTIRRPGNSHQATLVGAVRTALALLAVAGVACSHATAVTTVSVIDVSPATANVVVRQQVTLRATLKDAAGHALAGPHLFWSSEDSAVAVVSSSGVVTAVAPGRVRVAASAEGVTGTAVVTVLGVSVVTVVIVPDTLTITRGNTGQLRATAYDAGGNAVTGLAVAWGSGNQSVATVDAAGTVSGVATGTAGVTAAIAGRIGSATVVVVHHRGD